MGDIRDSATHLLSVINDILDLSRAEAAALPLDPRPLDLARLLRSTVRMLQPKADQGGLTLSLDVDPPALPAVVDEVRIRQVIVNLLSNAIKFTEPGGWVTITARRTVDVGQEERGAGWIRIEIADDGIGMPPGEIERAFEPFVQLDAGFSRRFEGTGLGLPLARRLVEAHGGRLNLFSEPGEGTQAVILLPLPAEGGRDED
jgi:signal transduction histidine kinase